MFLYGEEGVHSFFIVNPSGWCWVSGDVPREEGVRKSVIVFLVGYVRKVYLGREGCVNLL